MLVLHYPFFSSQLASDLGVDRALFPCGDAMVCIIDDREDVWKMAPNLVHVRPYHFFDGTADINAPPEASKSDIDTELTEGASVKTTRRNVRIVRVPKKPRHVGHREDTGQDSASKLMSVVTSDNNPLDNGTSVNRELKPNDAVTALDTSANNYRTSQTDASITQVCSDPAPREVTAESSSSVNSTLDSVMTSAGAAADHVAERHSDDNDEKITPASDADAGIVPDIAASDGPLSKPVDAVMEKTAAVSEEKVGEYEEFVEWEDLDDYLVYLEDILRRIHTAYYELYDEMQADNDNSATSAAPDLKTIVPYVRRKVLKGARIVFSGVCPLRTDPAVCRIYRVAESMGAVIQTSVVSEEGTGSTSEATTHVVAARAGTEKVKAALRQKSAWIVNPDWLWTCADRWEWVDERLYPLNDETSARFLSQDSPDPTVSHPRKKDIASNSSLKVGASASEAADSNGGSRYSLVTLSKEDISGMDAEVDKILDEESDSEYEDDETEVSGGSVVKESQPYAAEADNEDDADLRKQVLSSFCGGGKRKYEESSDEESLSGDVPKGWKNSSRKRHRASGGDDKLAAMQGNAGDDDEGNECDVKSDNGQSDNLSSSGSEDEEFNESIGSADEEIAATIEKELLS